MDWQKVKLCKSEQLSKEVKALTFEFLAPQKFLPGQYYELRIGESDRPYSVSSAPQNERELQFTIKFLKNGAVSPKLFDLKIGETISARGPFSDDLVYVESITPLVLIGGGTGVGPLMSILRYLNSKPQKRKVVGLFSFKTESDWLFKDEMQELFLNLPEAKLPITLTQELGSSWKGARGRINEEMLKNATRNLVGEEIYVCGATPFVEGVTQQLLLLGLDQQKVFAERFGGRVSEE